MPVMLYIALASSASGSVGGPSARELAATINAAPVVAGGERFSGREIRDLRCRAFDEEPTEFQCRFTSRSPKGRSKRYVAIAALDRDSWLLTSLD